MSDINLYTIPKTTTPKTIYQDGGDLSTYDSSFWNNQNSSFSTQTTSLPMSGYEQFNIKYEAAQGGSTVFSKYSFDGGDNNLREKRSSPSFTTTYNNITLRGRPGERIRHRSAFIPSVTGFDSSDVKYTGSIGDSNGTVEVFERWPTTQFFASADDDNDVARYQSGRIVNGTAPLTATFSDFSIARSLPISGWFINYGDGTSDSFTTANATYHPANSITVHENLFTHLYQRPNTYYATLYTQASTTSTKSAQLVTSNFVDEVSARVDVLPVDAQNNFFLISGESVGSNYSATNPHSPSAVSTFGGTFISGYSPNLTVTFQDSSVPGSFPIGVYNWNTGDVFDSSSSRVNVSATQVLSGQNDGWVTDKTNHYITYKYRFPGTYAVSLGTTISAEADFNPEYSTTTATVCSRTLLVHVDEIEPQASFGMSNISTGPFLSSVTFDSTPMTVYFNASSVVAGSFPIGRVEWDFGNGTEQTVLSSSTATFPQNVTVSAEYVRTVVTQPSTFNVGMSAFAFNTDSVATYSITGLGPLTVQPVSSLSNIDFDKPAHLIEGKMYDSTDELLLVFEGENKSTFNYLVSAPNIGA